jgi:hypothetical protein
MSIIIEEVIAMKLAFGLVKPVTIEEFPRIFESLLAHPLV